MATKALWVALIGVVVGVFMATADVLSHQPFIQVSAWLSLFFLGVVLSFRVLFNLPRGSGSAASDRAGRRGCTEPSAARTLM